MINFSFQPSALYTLTAPAVPKIYHKSGSYPSQFFIIYLQVLDLKYLEYIKSNPYFYFVIAESSAHIEHYLCGQADF
jgi:hypothetical protein